MRVFRSVLAAAVVSVALAGCGLIPSPMACPTALLSGRLALRRHKR
jgi:predicted small lipoprotein YifL